MLQGKNSDIGSRPIVFCTDSGGASWTSCLLLHSYMCVLDLEMACDHVHYHLLWEVSKEYALLGALVYVAEAFTQNDMITLCSWGVKALLSGPRWVAWWWPRDLLISSQVPYLANHHSPILDAWAQEVLCLGVDLKSLKPEFGLHLVCILFVVFTYRISRLSHSFERFPVYWLKVTSLLFADGFLMVRSKPELGHI